VKDGGLFKLTEDLTRRECHKGGKKRRERRRVREGYSKRAGKLGA
jgi:hypothetical protein